MESILFLAYIVWGYWAFGVLNEGKIYIYSKPGQLFFWRVGCAALVGWIMIPIALIKRMLFRR